eukprot:2262699-Pleurochrysis_carterae.AAC.4
MLAILANDVPICTRELKNVHLSTKKYTSCAHDGCSDATFMRTTYDHPHPSNGWCTLVYRPALSLLAFFKHAP